MLVLFWRGPSSYILFLLNCRYISVVAYRWNALSLSSVLQIGLLLDLRIGPPLNISQQALTFTNTSLQFCLLLPASSSGLVLPCLLSQSWLFIFLSLSFLGHENVIKFRLNSDLIKFKEMCWLTCTIHTCSYCGSKKLLAPRSCVT